MDLKVIIDCFRPEDYEDIKVWCEKRSCPLISTESLSETGFIVKVREEKIMAGWFYHTNSNIAWLEFVITNPDSSSENRHQALDLFFETTVNYAKECGIKNLFAVADDNGIIERMQKQNFNVSNNKVFILGRSL